MRSAMNHSLPCSQPFNCHNKFTAFRCSLFLSRRLKSCKLRFPKYRCRLERRIVHVKAFGEDSFDIDTFDDWGFDDTNVAAAYILSSSDGEDNDGEVLLTPLSEVDLPAAASVSNSDALTVTAHRLAMIGRGHRRKQRIKKGVLNNLGLIIFITIIVLFVDLWAWKIVRLPLAPCYVSRPFFISAALVSFAGYICVPLLNDLKIHQLMRLARPVRQSKKITNPTMGGLFFIPIGVGVAKFLAGVSSVEVSGVAFATLAFASIGLLSDILVLIRKQKQGLSAWIKILLEVAVGIFFSVWLDSAHISSPYRMKMVVPLPAPVGLVCLGHCYFSLTSICFLSAGNGVSLTDGLDGMAAGTAAWAFIGMSIAVLPICPELAVFGASMAGACVGFLLHNRYKASVFMGEIGSLALGGALAAMAACTGMFFPLFISSGVYIIEASSVVIQALYFKKTKHVNGADGRPFKMVPFHHHLLLCRLKEPIIVAGAYVLSGVFALIAGYIGLISV